MKSSPDFETDRFWLNGEEAPLTKRFMACINQLRSLRMELEAKEGSAEAIANWKLHISSENNFPTAAGLASSASGFACLVYTISRLYGLIGETPSLSELESLSRVARLGSGSACRSLMGGFVKWEVGSLNDGSDSIAVQVAARQHWPDMCALILVTNDAKKSISSTSGMQTTVNSSPLFKERLSVVKQRMNMMENAIVNKDFPAFAELTMKDSNQFHAVCLDTFPPIFYMNDTSKAIVRIIDSFNEKIGRLAAAYTFDAGPNAVIYTLESDLNNLIEFVAGYFDHYQPMPLMDENLSVIFKQGAARGQATVLTGNLVKRIILTKVGEGPRDV